MKPLIIRADAGGRTGTGHIMRMIALAQRYLHRGGCAIIATASCPESVSTRIESSGIKHHALTSEVPGSPEDATETIALALELDSPWLVLDGYQFDLQFQRSLRGHLFKVLCTDDHGYSDNWCCDAILNQNLNSEIWGNYPNEISESTLLLGSSFCLLREEFITQTQSEKTWGPLHRILITLGGSDPNNATESVLNLLNKAAKSPLEIRVLVGPDNPHLDQLKSLNTPHDIEFLTAVLDMPSQYDWADGVISAGGSSCWEWLYFGLPGLVVTIAENQEPIVRELTRESIALCPGWPAEWTNANSLSQWLEAPEKLLDQDRARSLIDGRGADRVASAIEGSPCLIRNTDPVLDRQFTFDLVNDPTVRSAGYATDEIPWQNHCDWLERHHMSPDSHLFIIETTDQNPTGLLRFHRAGKQWEIGIALTSDSRGRGYADHGIRLGMTELSVRHNIRHFLATIRPTNTSSKNLFTRLGFQFESREDERETWTLDIK